MAPVKLHVFLREIVANDADEIDRAEETRRYGCMTGGAAKKARIFGAGRFDGIERRGTDDENTHGKERDNEAVGGRAAFKMGRYPSRCLNS